MLVALLSVLAQLPPTIPVLGAEPLGFPPATRVPITIVGRPALSWDGRNWVLVWRDTRRLSGPVAISHVYGTPWDGTAAPRFPHGLPLPGASPVGLDDLQVASTPNNTFILYAQGTPDGGGTLTVVPTLRDAGLSGSWAGTIDVSQGEPVRFGSAVLATSGAIAVAGWFVGDEVHLVSVPGMTSVRLDAGTDAQSLSLGGIADGGFLVAWVNASGRAIATTLAPGTLTPGARVEVPQPGVRATQAVSTPTPLVTTQVTSSGAWVAWRGALFNVGQQWPITATSFAPVTVATTTSVVNLYRAASATFVNAAPLGSLTSMNGQVLVAAPPLEPAALAAADNDAMALLVNGARVFGLPLSVDYNGTSTPSVTPRGVVPLLDAPARQRAPSVVWVDQQQAFLIAWDEEQVGGGSALMTTWLDLAGRPRGVPTVLQSLPLSDGLRPTLLRRPSGGAYGIQLRASPSQRAIFNLAIDGGVVSLGSQLSMPRVLGNAVLGDAIEVQWGGITLGSGGWAGSETSARFLFTGPSPTCAAAAARSLWFASLESGGLKLALVDDGPGPTRTITGTMSFVGAASGVCALAMSSGTDVAVALKHNARLQVLTTPVAMPQLVPLASFDSVFGGEPLLVETTEGLVVAWTGRGTVGVEAVLARTGQTPVSLGGGIDVENLSGASSPSGVAAIVWDGFVASAGARQVFVRLVGSLDAGAMRDGGVVMPGDGGIPDAGGPVDAGPDDAGVFDGGEFDDAGVLDGTDGGTSSDLLFVPISCGCQSSPVAAAAFLALLGVSRVSRRRRAAT